MKVKGYQQPSPFPFQWESETQREVIFLKEGRKEGRKGGTNPPAYAMNPLLDIYHVIFTNTLKTPIFQVSKLNQEPWNNVSESSMD